MRICGLLPHGLASGLLARRPAAACCRGAPLRLDEVAFRTFLFVDDEHSAIALRIALARAYRDAGRTAEVQALAEELLREDPDDRRAWGLLGPDAPGDR